ncbi:hypothetical protein BGZ97_007065 [Linnemannia gamsii]|jgi:hypothetical protein|uniref:Uncharacterized protein n=1 Tax=Linnemannia gamsii TaxID=64522 RepID=A0A9P6UEB1_9FUNG|nr:hypothetical protein BGZ97_007065 [Linnemannia gamsii]
MTLAIVGLRIWLAFVCLANLATVGTFYGWYVGTLINQQQESLGRPRYVYEWVDYGMIISSSLLFISYVYSIWGKRPLASNKYARAVLMLIPGLVLLGISLRQIHLQITKAKAINDNRQSESEMGNLNPFSCAGWGESTGFCIVIQCYFFVPIITGFFVIFEVLVTLLKGPIHSVKGDY